MLKIFFFITLFMQSAFANTLSSTESVNLLFFGAFSMIIVYNFTYFLILKSHTYFEYFVFHLLLFIMMLSYSGLFEAGFFTYNLSQVPVVLFMLAVMIFTSFTRSFLLLKTSSPKGDKVLKSFQYVALVLFAFSMWEIQYTPIIIFALLYVIALSLSILVISSYLAYRKNQTYAKFYLFAFIGLLTTLIITLLSYFSFIESSSNSRYLFELSIIFETVVFSYGLNYQYQETQLQLEQNRLLFKELSHRVKNNLQSIISILSLQKSRLDDETMKRYLQDTIKRISAIALIHEKLQQTAQVGHVNMKSYLNSFLEEFQTIDHRFKFNVACDKEIYLPIEKLTPLGLILNELVTNSLKHAFNKTTEPMIKIKLTHETYYDFSYEDNGAGYKIATPSLGTLLIKTLAEAQLKGKYSINHNGRLNYQLQFS